MTLPTSADGYAIDTATGIVHRRNAAHARALPKTRTEAGALGHLGATPASACPGCFPAQPIASPVRRRVTRKPAAKRKPTPKARA